MHGIGVLCYGIRIGVGGVVNFENVVNFNRWNRLFIYILYK
jgi:hypothetical protein